MYELTIETDYNIIQLLIEDTQDPEVLEILEQPWVKQVKLEPVSGEPKEGYKKLVKRRYNEKTCDNSVPETHNATRN